MRAPTDPDPHGLRWEHLQSTGGTDGTGNSPPVLRFAFPNEPGRTHGPVSIPRTPARKRPLCDTRNPDGKTTDMVSRPEKMPFLQRKRAERPRIPDLSRRPGSPFSDHTLAMRTMFAATKITVSTAKPVSITRNAAFFLIRRTIDQTLKTSQSTHGEKIIR